jgi:hypothetical protein
MRRVLAIALMTSALGLSAEPARPVAPSGPEIRFTDGTPADVRALAERTWLRFLDAFPARRGCLEPVIVEGAWELADRGSYDAAAARVTLRIPGTAPNLEATLVHEFAHHLEASCPEHVRLREAFLLAHGMSTNTSWFDGATWSSTPSEQLAEAVTVAVLGRRPSHLRTFVDATTVELIRRWGEGG